MGLNMLKLTPFLFNFCFTMAMGKVLNYMYGSHLYFCQTVLHQSRPLVLKVQSKDQQHQHHLGVCQKCRIFAPPAGILNQKLILRIAPGNSYTKFERHCHSNTFRIFFQFHFFFISCYFLLQRLVSFYIHGSLFVSSFVLQNHSYISYFSVFN